MLQKKALMIMDGIFNTQLLPAIYQVVLVHGRMCCQLRKSIGLTTAELFSYLDFDRDGVGS